MADAVVVAIEGEVDVETVPGHRARIHDAIAAHPGTAVVVDLSGVTFLDSTGLGMLVSCLRRAREAGGELRAQAAPTNVARLFTITGLDKVIPLC